MPVHAAPPNLKLSEDLLQMHKDDFDEAQLTEAVTEQLEAQDTCMAY